MSESNDQQQNRRARRAAAKQSGKPMAAPTTAPKIKLAQPDYSRPKENTLLGLYDQHKDLLDKGQPFDQRYGDGQARDEKGNVLLPTSDDAVVGLAADAFFWAISLGMLHLTLDVLARKQYLQDDDLLASVKRSATIVPILWLVVYMLRTKTAQRWRYARQVFFMVVAIASGCYTITIANRYSFYAVMKQAPPLGTLWIYSVIEMELPLAVVSLFVNGGYLWYNGFTVF